MPFVRKHLSLAVLAMLSGPCLAAGTDANDPVVGRALAMLQINGKTLHASTADSYFARDLVIDQDGTEHVRFERRYAGLEVLGGDFVLHSRNGRMLAATQTLRAPLRLGVRPTLTADDAIVVAGARFGSDFSGTPESVLIVDARGKRPVRLAYRVRLSNADKDMSYLVDAHSGAVIDDWSDRHTAAATGTAKTLFSGNVTLTTNSIAGGYELRDPARGGGYTINAGTGATSGQIYKDADNVWGNNAMTDGATPAADAQFGSAMTWDYYKNVHGRLGIANNGKGAYNRVHYGRKYANAFWADNCFCMTYGDGDGRVVGPMVSLDISGHEMSHGVMSRTANLVYSGESGALNEANSDIFGTMTEFYANNPTDTPDYMIGEKIYLANVPGSSNPMALRYMFDPSKDGLSPNCYNPNIGEMDVHYSSGPANRFFYLLAEGSGARTYSGVNHQAPTCNGGSVTGVGRTKAEKIWYRAITVYMTSDTGYAGARTATLNAASDLYGPASAERNAVIAAWKAVGVN
ncbi:M4 family metallopeptidase [Arenimonas sp.]|uniref:M4 family metallopeptidase n=1 Tax=Arenimonas sp. TaxID=1872635 RepID=UPI0039E49715